jgi:hypothetical protein
MQDHRTPSVLDDAAIRDVIRPRLTGNFDETSIGLILNLVAIDRPRSEAEAVTSLRTIGDLCTWGATHVPDEAAG